MGIMTKKGDRGRTKLCFGSSVSKNDDRIEANGDLDETMSYLGLARSLSRSKIIDRLLERIQRDLVCLCAEVATEKINIKKLKRRISSGEVIWLEAQILEFEDRFRPKNCFVSARRGSELRAFLHVARSVTRRSERRCLSLLKKNLCGNWNILVYLNRLSDLLFLMATAS